MTIWSSEIKDLERLHSSFKGQHRKLDTELEKLVKTDDENIVLVYARRCLELIITDLCEYELKRPRGTEPLKGIIDRLNREGIVPENIITSMHSLNSMSTFGAHPKDFDPRQVKPVILDLTTILEWYLMYLETHPVGEAGQEVGKEERKELTGLRKKPAKPLRRTIQVLAVLLICTVIVVVLILTDMISGGKQVRAGTIGSIIILPFENFTGVDTLEYFVSGMHSSLIQDMGKIGNLHIPGTTTSKFYKNANKTIEQITKETNVDAALETSVLCLGEDSICFQTRLLKPGQEEEQLWIADYKIPRNQILNWYNRITKQIAEEVKVKLTPRQEILLAESKTINEEAYDNYLKGRHYWDRLGKEDLEKALEYFNRAIELEPGWAPPYSGIAEVFGGLMQMGFIDPGGAIIEINKNLDKAIELDPDYPGSHYTKAVLGVWMEWDWEKGEREFLKALEINPNDVMSRIYYSHLLMILKRYDEASFHSQMAVELDPLNPLILALSSVVDHSQGDVRLALEKCEKALSIDPGHYFASSAYENACFSNGDYENFIKNLLKYRTQMNEEIREDINNSFKEKGITAAINTYLGFLEEYARNNYVPYIDMAVYNLWANNIEMGIENYKKAYEMHDPNLPYITHPWLCFEKVKDDPRIISIVKEMNLPFE